MTTEKTYTVVNGTYYNPHTDPEVIRVLENCRVHHIRIILDYGDVTTGKSWGEEHGIVGYVGRSSGTVKIPLVIFNSKSFGGGSLLSHCIVGIKSSRGKIPLYKWAPRGTTPKEMVLKVFPGAVAYLDEETNVWYIFDDTVEKGFNPPLGQGGNAEEAWNRASKNTRVLNH